MSEANEVEHLVKWPRGRYNGKRITGLTIKIGFDVDKMYWKPLFHHGYGQPMFLWLFIRLYVSLRYKD